MKRIITALVVGCGFTGIVLAAAPTQCPNLIVGGSQSYLSVTNGNVTVNPQNVPAGWRSVTQSGPLSNTQAASGFNYPFVDVNLYSQDGNSYVAYCEYKLANVESTVEIQSAQPVNVPKAGGNWTYSQHSQGSDYICESSSTDECTWPS